MEVIIRESTEKDLEQILSLYEQPDMDDGRVLSLGQVRLIYNKMKSYPYYKVYVAEADHTIVGTYALLIMDNMAHMGSPSGVIEDVVVSCQYQRQGIGKQMMEHAVQCCKTKSCYKAALSSNLKRTNAHSFYESLGFKRHGYSFLLEL